MTAGKKATSAAKSHTGTVSIDKVVDTIEAERQRAVLLSHLARTVTGEFLPSDVGDPPLSITSPDGSVAPARRAVVEEVAAELERMAGRARGHIHRLLAEPVAVELGARADDGVGDKPAGSAGGTVANDRPRAWG